MAIRDIIWGKQTILSVQIQEYDRNKIIFFSSEGYTLSKIKDLELIKCYKSRAGI